MYIKNTHSSSDASRLNLVQKSYIMFIVCKGELIYLMPREIIVSSSPTDITYRGGM